MTINFVSTAYLAQAMLPAVNHAQSQLATLETESATGQYADLGLHLGAQSGYELSLRGEDDLLQTLTTTNQVAQTNMTAAQSALSSTVSTAQTAAASLATLANGGSGSQSLQLIGQANLQQLVSLANTSTPSGYLFAGDNTATPPLNDYFASGSPAKSAVDVAFQSFFGFSTGSSQVANITNSQMQSFLSGPFASEFQSPAWEANWSTASNSEVQSEIAPGNTITTSVNTNSAGFQNLAQGYAMLSEFGGIGLGAGAQQALALTAVNTINQGVSAMTTTQAGLGAAQSQLTQANADMSSQMTILQTQVGNLDSVDAAQIATELSALSTQLQSAYQLTAQIQKLSLAQYIPT